MQFVCNAPMHYKKLATRIFWKASQKTGFLNLQTGTQKKTPRSCRYPFFQRSMYLRTMIFLFQVTTIFHDSTIGNLANIILVRIMYLEEEEVSIHLHKHIWIRLLDHCLTHKVIRSSNMASWPPFQFCLSDFFELIASVKHYDQLLYCLLGARKIWR